MATEDIAQQQSGRVVVADYGGPGSSRNAYHAAREIAGHDGQIVIVHPLDPMLNFFGVVSEPVTNGDEGHVLDQIDHRLRDGVDGHDDEILFGPLPRAVLAAAHGHDACAIVVGEELGIHDETLPITVVPA